MEEEDIYKEGNLFVIKKEIEGKMITFGSFNTLEEAIAERDELEEYGWPYLPEEPEEKPIEEDYGQYISKRDGKFVVSRAIRGKEKIFGSFDTLDEAKEYKYKLIENAWDISKFKFKSKYGKFIHKKDNRYYISRTIFGEVKYIGSYLTLEEALDAREKLIDDNWGVEGKIYYFNIHEYGQYITFFNGYYRIKVPIDGKLFDFGEFDTLENATVARDILIENYWDSTKVPDYLYAKDFFIDYRPFMKSYEVSNVIGDELISFGLFSSYENAISAVDILIENNWDLSFIPFELYADNSNIYGIGGYYYVIRKINEEIKYYKRFENYDDALYERNKYLMSNWKINENLIEEEKYDEYIYLKQNGKFYVKYEIDGKMRVFGVYDDPLDAMNARLEFMKKGWKVPYLYGEEIVEKEDSLSFIEIYKIFDSIKLIEEPESPFPQADNLNTLVDICKFLYERVRTKDEIMENFSIKPRYYSFYISAGQYLGLIEKNKNKVFLSREGLIVFKNIEKEIYKSLIKLILQHKPFYKPFNLYLKNEQIPSIDEIFDILNQIELYNIDSDVTIRRRAGTVRSWIKWIVSLYEE